MNNNDLHETELGSFHSGSIYKKMINGEITPWGCFEVSNDNKRTVMVS